MTECTVTKQHDIDLENAATFISKVFVESPLFKNIEEHRYQRDKVLERLRSTRLITTFLGQSMTGVLALADPDPMSPCSTFRFAPSIVLMAVDEDYRGQGFAARLCAEAERIAKSEGAAVLALSATQRGDVLPPVYEKIGFVKIEEFRWPDAVDKSWIMVKALSLS